MLAADQAAKADQQQAAKPDSQIHDGIVKESMFLAEKMQSGAIILNKP
jgi:hypothetical protein